MAALNLKFKYLDHTSEAKFQAYGKTMEEAFGNAVLAMFAMLTDISKVNQKITTKIEKKSTKLDTLLFDFLDEFIILLDVEGLIVSKIEKITIVQKMIQEKEVYTLTAIVKGDSYKKYEVHGDIKAVTYNDMMIQEENGNWTVQVVVDI